jgi:hypothetical protein
VAQDNRRILLFKAAKKNLVHFCDDGDEPSLKTRTYISYQMLINILHKGGSYDDDDGNNNNNKIL